MLGAATLVLAAGIAGTALQVRRRERAAMRSHPPEGRFLTVGDQRIHVVELGQPRGSAPDLVLIHGASGNTRDMTFRLAPALADRFRVIVFDRPGLGYSDPVSGSHGTLREQAGILQQVAAQLGAETPIVLGQSYGGAVALAWAVYHPDHISALISVAGVSHPWEGGLDAFYRLTSSSLGAALAVPLLTGFVPYSKIQTTLAEVFAPQDVPQGYIDHFGPGLTLRRTSLRINALQRAHLKDEIRAQQPLYHKIQIPIEVIHCADDSTVGLNIHSKRLIAEVPTARLSELSGIGHMPHHLVTDEVVAAVIRAHDRIPTA